MTAEIIPIEPPDGGLTIDPRAAKVLLRLREKVAQATEEAVRELLRLGYGYDWIERRLMGWSAGRRSSGGRLSGGPGAR